MTSRLLLLTLLVAGFAAGVDHVRPAGAQPRVVMLASTIGPVDAGIVGALEDAYLKRTGVVVRHVGVGTGAALEIAKGGSFDLVMVHARSLEDRFVADGFGVDRRDLMYNDFAILGPAGDPARIRGEKKAVDALRKIAGAQAPFLTWGDRSGTHVKEVELWEAAGVKPQGSWYVTSERGAAGNVATTRDANTRQAYVLMDRATYLTLKKEITLAVLVERDPVLLNYIAEGFEVDRYGEPLFFPNSDDWRKRFGGSS